MRNVAVITVWKGPATMRVSEFNTADVARARDLVAPCLDIPRWVDAVVAGRPYPDVEAAATTAATAADPFTSEEIERALVHHPRIGEKARGSSTEAGLSRTEQAGLETSDDIQRRLVEGNRAYEQRFGRVFLIRAAGRTSAQILDQLDQRLGNDDATEERIVADQLRQIAVLRLRGALEGEHG